jgi:hypothetical protein
MDGLSAARFFKTLFLFHRHAGARVGGRAVRSSNEPLTIIGLDGPMSILSEMKVRRIQRSIPRIERERETAFMGGDDLRYAICTAKIEMAERVLDGRPLSRKTIHFGDIWDFEPQHAEAVTSIKSSMEVCG